MTEIIYISDIGNYIQEIINDELVLIPKQNINNITLCKQINHNDMNLFEIILDLSKAIDINLFNDEKFISHYKGGLLRGIPKHSNLYYIISIVYNQKVPKWFATKYNDIEEKIWEEYIEN